MTQQEISSQRPAHARWYVILVVVSLLLPVVGGLAVLIVSRLPRFRGHIPRLRVLVLIWLGVTAVQLVGLFASFPFTSSIETVIN